MAILRGNWTAAVAATLVLGLGLAGGIAAAADRAVGALIAVSPQPTEKSVTAGLQVRYLSPKIRYIDELVRYIRSRPGTPGPVIAALDFGDKGPGAHVMGTKESEMVGAVVEGMIKFDRPGHYELCMAVNDLAQLHIGGQLVIEKDWDGLPTQLGDPVGVTVVDAGWYPLRVLYYQRKGTAALELLWKTPGQAGDYELVPASAFAHLAE